MGIQEEFFISQSTARNFICLLLTLVIVICLMKVEKKKPMLGFCLFLFLYYLGIIVSFYNRHVILGSGIAVVSYLWAISKIKIISGIQLRKEVQSIIAQEIEESSASEDKFTDGNTLVGHPAVDQLRRTQNIKIKVGKDGEYHEKKS